MSFYSVTKFSILSPLNVMNRFTLQQRWNLLENYFQNKDNQFEIFFAKIIKFPDEVYFHLGWYFHKQYCRTLGIENPHMVLQIPITSDCLVRLVERRHHWPIHHIDNWPLKPFSQDCGLASRTTHVMCINFICEWRDPSV